MNPSHETNSPRELDYLYRAVTKFAKSCGSNVGTEWAFEVRVNRVATDAKRASKCRLKAIVDTD